MNWAKIILDKDGTYSALQTSHTDMFFVCRFFCDLVGRSRETKFRDWANKSTDSDRYCVNYTYIERDIDDILVGDDLFESPTCEPTRMTVEQFIDLFDAWQRAVSPRPKQFVIRRETSGQFFIDASDEYAKSNRLASSYLEESEECLRKKYEKDYARIALTACGRQYYFMKSSDRYMSILGYFFSSEVECRNTADFRYWLLTGRHGDTVMGQDADLEREFDDILLSDVPLFDEEDLLQKPTPTFTKLRIPVKTLLQLYDEWQAKVVKQRPTEIFIKHEHGRYYIETYNW